MIGRIVVRRHEHAGSQRPAEKPGQTKAQLDVELEFALEGVLHVATRPSESVDHDALDQDSP